MALLVFLGCLARQRLPEPFLCVLPWGLLPRFFRPERRTPILVIYVGAASAMIWLGFDPLAVIGLLTFCGLISADTAIRLLGPPPGGGLTAR